MRNDQQARKAPMPRLAYGVGRSQKDIILILIYSLILICKKSQLELGLPGEPLGLG
jgi:hypothetical protein